MSETAADPWAVAVGAVLDGQTYRAAAAAAGVEESQLRRRMRLLGLAPARPRGGRPVVTDEERVRALWEAGWTQRAIADELGVSPTAVANALDRGGAARLTRHRPYAARRRLTAAEVDTLARLASPGEPPSDRLADYIGHLVADGVPQVWVSRAAGRYDGWARYVLTRRRRLPPPHPPAWISARARWS